MLWWVDDVLRHCMTCAHCCSVQMEEQRAAAAYEKQQAEVEAAKKATLAGSEVDFLRERAAALQVGACRKLPNSAWRLAT